MHDDLAKLRRDLRGARKLLSAARNTPGNWYFNDKHGDFRTLENVLNATHLNWGRFRSILSQYSSNILPMHRNGIPAITKVAVPGRNGNVLKRYVITDLGMHEGVANYASRPRGFNALSTTEIQSKQDVLDYHKELKIKYEEAASNWLGRIIIAAKDFEQVPTKLLKYTVAPGKELTHRWQALIYKNKVVFPQDDRPYIVHYKGASSINLPNEAEAKKLLDYRIDLTRVMGERLRPYLDAQDTMLNNVIAGAAFTTSILDAMFKEQTIVTRRVLNELLGKRKRYDSIVREEEPYVERLSNSLMLYSGPPGVIRAEPSTIDYDLLNEMMKANLIQVSIESALPALRWAAVTKTKQG